MKLCSTIANCAYVIIKATIFECKVYIKHTLDYVCFWKTSWLSTTMVLGPKAGFSNLKTNDLFDNRN